MKQTVSRGSGSSAGVWRMPNTNCIKENAQCNVYSQLVSLILLAVSFCFFKRVKYSIMQSFQTNKSGPQTSINETNRKQTMYSAFAVLHLAFCKTSLPQLVCSLRTRAGQHGMKPILDAFRSVSLSLCTSQKYKKFLSAFSLTNKRWKSDWSFPQLNRK